MVEPLWEHKVSINWTSKLGRKVSMYLFFVVFVIFGIWYIVDIPARYVPSELSIPYYLDFLPRWLLKLFGIGIILGLLSFFFFDIRRNKRGILKIYKNFAALESKGKRDVIRFEKLKRITFITKLIALRPYRIEFIYPDFSVKRIRINKTKFYQIMEQLQEVTPKDFEIDFNSFESNSKV